MSRWLWSLGFLGCMVVFSEMTQEIAVADTVVILLDDSGSMAERMKASQTRITRIDAAKKALTQVIDSLPDDTVLGILLLNGEKQNNYWLVPLGPINRMQAKSRVQSLKAEGGTPLGQRIEQAMNELLTMRSKQVYGSYRLIVATDGEATDADRLRRILPGVLARGIPVDVIGVDMAQNHSLATQVRSYRRADDESQFSRAISEILAESQGTDDGAESDYEWIAPLPDELASAILGALAKPNNAPVELNENPLGELRDAVASQSGPAEEPWAGNFQQPAPANSFWSGLLGGVVV